MTSWLVVALDLVDALDLEGGARRGSRAASSRGIDAELGLRLAREDLDLLPDLELVLERPDAAHLGPGVAIDHGTPWSGADAMSSLSPSLGRGSRGAVGGSARVTRSGGRLCAGHAEPRAALG